MRGVQHFEFLTARGADLDELLRSLELAFVRIEFGSRGDESRLRFRKVRAEDLRHRLSAADTLAQFDEHARDASARRCGVTTTCLYAFGSTTPGSRSWPAPPPDVTDATTIPAR